MSDNPRDSRSSDDGKSRSVNGLILRRSSYNPTPRQRDSSHRSQWQSIRSQSGGIYNDAEEDARWDSAPGNSVESSSAYGRERTPSPIHPRGAPFLPATGFNPNSDPRTRSGSWDRLPGKSPQRSAWPDERNMPPVSGSRTERPRDWSYESSHSHTGDSPRPRDIIDGARPLDIPRGAPSGSHGPRRSSASFSDRADDTSSPLSSAGSIHYSGPASSHSRASSPHRPRPVASVDAYSDRTSPSSRISSITGDIGGRHLSASMDSLGPRLREAPKSYDRPPGPHPPPTSHTSGYPIPRPPINPRDYHGKPRVRVMDETDEFGRVPRKEIPEVITSNAPPSPGYPYRTPTRPRSPQSSGGSHSGNRPIAPGFRNPNGSTTHSASAEMHPTPTHAVPNGTAPTTYSFTSDSRRPGKAESHDTPSSAPSDGVRLIHTSSEEFRRLMRELLGTGPPSIATTSESDSAALQETKSSGVKPASSMEQVEMAIRSSHHSPSAPALDIRGASAAQAQHPKPLPTPSSSDRGTEISPSTEPSKQLIPPTGTVEQLGGLGAFANEREDPQPRAIPEANAEFRPMQGAVIKNEIDPEGDYEGSLQWRQRLPQQSKENPPLPIATASESTSQFKPSDEEPVPSVIFQEAQPMDGFSDTLRGIHEATSLGESDIIDAILSENHHLTHPIDANASGHADNYSTDTVVNGTWSPQKRSEMLVEDPRDPSALEPDETHGSRSIRSPQVPAMPPRLPADERFLLPPMDGETKTFTDALRKATYHLGPIMPIVDSILIWNNRLNSEPENRSGTSPEGLIAEVDSTEIREEDRKVVRSIETKLSDQFSRDRAELETKNQTLRDEYRGFLDSWDLHRQRLDRLEAVRNRKQNLLGGEDGSGRNRRGAISLGDAARSDLELDQIMASLVNEDLTNPDILARRNVAVIPDMLSVTDPRALECQYDDLNGLVSNPVAYADSVHEAGEWTPAEREIFIRAYMATPKQFGRISEQLPHKSSEQCVLFYYLNKKEINFKGLLSKQGGGRGRRRGRRAGKQKGNALLTDLRQPHADDEDLSVNDSSPAPGTPVSDSEAGPSRPRLSLRESTRTATKRRASRAASYDPDTGSDEDGQRSPSSNGRDKNGGDYEDNETRESSDAPHKSRKRLKVEDSSTAKDVVSRPRPRGGKGPSGKGSTTHWTLSDKAIFMRLLPIHGKNWAVIAEDLPDKTPVQVRNYFQNHSVELGLPAIAARAEKPPRGAGNPNKVETPRNENVVRLEMIIQSLGSLDFKPGQSASLPQGFKSDPSLESPRATIKPPPGPGPSPPSQSLPTDSLAPVPPPTGGVQIRFSAHDLNQRTGTDASQGQRTMTTGNT